MDKRENSLKRKEHVPKPCGKGHSETWSGDGGGSGGGGSTEKEEERGYMMRPGGS